MKDMALNKELVIKSFITLFIILILSSCSHKQGHRNPASDDRDLNGTALGIAEYKEETIVPRFFGGKKAGSSKIMRTRKRTTRFYLQEIENEKGAYYGIVLEYSNLLKMAPKYIASNKLPRLSDRIGYLNQIAKRIVVYKVTPGSRQNTYEMRKVRYVNNRLVSRESDRPSLLILADEVVDGRHALEGARITTSPDAEPAEISFPYMDKRGLNGHQYSIAKFTYNMLKLDSTWRMTFLPGIYLGAYGDLNDEVLDLYRGKGSDDKAVFKINKQRAHLRASKREGQFTNPKSAYIEGEYAVTMPASGIFVFHALDKKKPGVKHVENRLGLFIDIFDASEALNQDVVELVLVDSDNPEDFLMYYEHPDNGEGE